MLASVVPLISIATIPLALILPEFEIVKSEVSSAKILTVFDVIVEPESTVTLTVSPVIFAGFVALVFAITVAKMLSGQSLEGFDHTVRYSIDTDLQKVIRENIQNKNEVASE